MQVADRFFSYRFDDRFKVLLWPLRLREDEHGVTVTDDGRFVATFGRLTLETPMSNVLGGHVTEGYRWYTAIGPRLSFVDDGLTFGTNHRRGLCIEFAEKIPKVIGFRDHSALWVSVADPDGLASALDS